MKSNFLEIITRIASSLFILSHLVDVYERGKRAAIDY